MSSNTWKLRPWFCWLIAVVVLFGSYKLYGGFTKQAKREKSFSVEGTCINVTSAKQLYTTPEQIQEVNGRLDQPYFFLGKGKQCYAFVSADGKYVIKLFQKNCFNSKNFLASFPDFFLVKKLREKKLEQKEVRLERMLHSFELAYEKIPEETGVLYIHFLPTRNLHQQLTVLDKRGQMHTFRLDSVPFVLQRRADLVKETLMKLMYAGKEREAKKRIEQIFILLVTCAKQGIIDTDGALVRNDNLGFLDDRAVLIDTGKLEQSKLPITRVSFEHDLRRLRPLYNWLKKNYPSLADHFDDCRKISLEQFS